MNKLDITILKDFIQIFDNNVYNEVNKIILNIKNSNIDRRLHRGEITVEEYLTQGENDSKQKTQSITKGCQYYFASAIHNIIEDFKLHDIISFDNITSGYDFIHLPTKEKIELKTTGQKDGSAAATGNVHSNIKVNSTLILRYNLNGNMINEKQTLLIRNSNIKWSAEYGFEDEKKVSKNSGYSTMNCLVKDINDIECYSGSLKLNPKWVKFIKEKI